MKRTTSISKKTSQFASATAIHTPQLLHNYNQIRKRAQEIYAARGGIMGMTLNDWLKAEQELNQKLKS